MNLKRAFKWWAAALGLTLVVGVVWEWAGSGEVELTLGSYQREGEKTMGEVKKLDFGGEGCRFGVDERLEVRILSLLDKERGAAEVGRLRADGEMTRVARGHARDMIDGGYFSHYDSQGQDAGDRLAEASIGFTLVGENLGYGASVEAAHRGLMGSKAHRNNIVEARFARVGVGVLDGGKCGVVVVENFAD